jgi:coenzyme Q-binding protein COQ10
MPTHAEKKHLPYTPDQLFDLVLDVEKYPQFLPWCIACRITRREGGDTFYADLVIGYKFFREKFTSRVVTDRAAKTIQVEYLDGPLKNLANRWAFVDQGDGTTLVDFYVDFEFHNPIFQALMGLFFTEAVRRMVAAFETRAGKLYGGG